MAKQSDEKCGGACKACGGKGYKMVKRKGGWEYPETCKACSGTSKQ